jgi:hypothetical protein
MEAANAAMHRRLIILRCWVGIVVVWFRKRLRGSVLAQRTALPSQRGAASSALLLLSVYRLYQVFQENDCGVCHASLELAIDDGRHFQRRDSFVHDHARVPAKYACVMVHRLKRFQTRKENFGKKIWSRFQSSRLFEAGKKCGVVSNRRVYLKPEKNAESLPIVAFS